VMRASRGGSCSPAALLEMEERGGHGILPRPCRTPLQARERQKPPGGGYRDFFADPVRVV
jgi:hypothetical protein